MTYENPSFFEQFQDVVTDELYIGSTLEDLQREIRNNLWCISASQDEINQLTVQDWETFFVAIMENRSRQIRESGKSGMIFYMWFDEQAAQIRFCLISAFHEQLPFGNTIELVDQPEIIIEQFMNSPYHDGIPLSELTTVGIDEFEESAIPTKPTLVYQSILS
jgi:hypothetical protein